MMKQTNKQTTTNTSRALQTCCPGSSLDSKRGCSILIFPGGISALKSDVGYFIKRQIVSEEAMASTEIAPPEGPFYPRRGHRTNAQLSRSQRCQIIILAVSLLVEGRVTTVSINHNLRPVLGTCKLPCHLWCLATTCSSDNLCRSLRRAGGIGQAFQVPDKYGRLCTRRMLFV